MSPENDLEKLWEAAKLKGMTLEGAVELLIQKGFGKWGVNTVKAAIEGKSKELRELVLRKVLQEYLGFADSVKAGRAEPAVPEIAIHERPAESDTELWKRRAKAAEKQLANLRDGLRYLLDRSADVPPVNLGELDETQRAAKQASSFSKNDPST